jgi:hypothetical protein
VSHLKEGWQDTSTWSPLNVITTNGRITKGLDRYEFAATISLCHPDGAVFWRRRTCATLPAVFMRRGVHRSSGLQKAQAIRMTTRGGLHRKIKWFRNQCCSGLITALRAWISGPPITSQPTTADSVPAPICLPSILECYAASRGKPHWSTRSRQRSFDTPIPH